MCPKNSKNGLVESKTFNIFAYNEQLRKYSPYIILHNSINECSLFGPLGSHEVTREKL